MCICHERLSWRVATHNCVIRIRNPSRMGNFIFDHILSLRAVPVVRAHQNQCAPCSTTDRWLDEKALLALMSWTKKFKNLESGCAFQVLHWAQSSCFESNVHHCIFILKDYIRALKIRGAPHELEVVSTLWDCIGTCNSAFRHRCASHMSTRPGMALARCGRREIRM